jgi:hypothetical protein
MRKKISLIAVIMVCLFLMTTISSAHTLSQTGIVQGSDNQYANAGWNIFEVGGHNNNATVRYRLSTTDPNLTPFYTSRIQEAEASSMTGWGDVSPYTVQQVSTSGDFIGVVDTYYNDNPNDLIGNALAYYIPLSVNSAGHVTSWQIRLNRAHSSLLKTHDIVHEFGHAFGLDDLYSTNNKDKLRRKSQNMLINFNRVEELLLDN